MLTVRSFKNGYSKELFKKLVGNTDAYILIGSGLNPQYAYDDQNKRTNTVAAQRMDFYFKDVGTQSVKFPANFKLSPSIKDMTKITFINPKAIQVRNRYYMKADDLKPATK